MVERILARRPALRLGEERSEPETRRLVDEALGDDPGKAKAAMAKLNWHESGEGGLLNEITDDRGQTVAFGRTALGQAAYDVIISSLSGAEVARRHPELTRLFVLDMRRTYRKLRPRRAPRRFRK